MHVRELNGFGEVAEAINQNFGIPVAIVEAAISGMGELRNLWA